MADDISKQDMYAYSVYWKTVTVGLIKGLDPSGVAAIVKEKKMTPFGDVVLDRVRRGATGVIKTTIHQTDLDTLKGLCPWWTTGAVSGTPASTNYSEYVNAGPLLLHPFGVPLTSKDNDVTFVKAFPNFKLPKAGGDWREVECEWNIYPDQAQLASGIFISHYLGAPPT